MLVEDENYTVVTGYWREKCEYENKGWWDVDSSNTAAHHPEGNINAANSL